MLILSCQLIQEKYTKVYEKNLISTGIPLFSSFNGYKTRLSQSAMGVQAGELWVSQSARYLSRVWELL